MRQSFGGLEVRTYTIILIVCIMVVVSIICWDVIVFGGCSGMGCFSCVVCLVMGG